MKVNKRELDAMYNDALIEKIKWVENEDEEDDNDGRYINQVINNNPKPISGKDLLLYCATFGSQIKNIVDLEMDDLYYLRFVGFGGHEIIKVLK